MCKLCEEYYESEAKTGIGFANGWTCPEKWNVLVFDKKWNFKGIKSFGEIKKM